MSNKVKDKVQTTVSPVLDDNGQPLFISIGAARLPMLEYHTPEHTTVSGGVTKTAAAKTLFRASIPTVDSVLALVVAAIAACENDSDRLVLTERIFGPWLATASDRAYVPDPVNIGETQWSEEAMAKDLSSPRTTRKAGTSIEDLRAAHNDLNNQIIPLLEFRLQMGAGEPIDWDAVSSAVGRHIREEDALVEYLITLRGQLKAVKWAIAAREETLQKAAKTRSAKAKRAPVEAVADATAEAVQA